MKLGIVGLPNVGKSTLFNAINVILAVFVLVTGSYKNMLFMIVIVCNVVIGIVQEIRSKITTDRLSIVAGSHATVIRDGARIQVTEAQMALARAKWEEILEQLKPDFTDVLLDQTPRQASR